MNRIDQKLEQIRNEKKMGLMTHVVVGYPSIEQTLAVVRAMAHNGADFVELQIPFSDPLADGPTIMQACEKSLANGTKVKDAFLVMKTLSKQVSIPLLFMSYYNIVFRYGVEKFCRDAMIAGASGLIVPDMPLDEEEQEHFYAYSKKYNLHAIQVVSPASTEERLTKNAKVANGFIYCTARQGTTGAKKDLDPTVRDYLKKVKDIFPVPVAVGFGISTREHVLALRGVADIAIVGSAFIEVINNTGEKDRIQAIKKFITDLQVE
jgi:tryptophan synthase alpha chain